MMLISLIRIPKHLFKLSQETFIRPDSPNRRRQTWLLQQMGFPSVARWPSSLKPSGDMWRRLRAVYVVLYTNYCTVHCAVSKSTAVASLLFRTCDGEYIVASVGHNATPRTALSLVKMKSLDGPFSMKSRWWSVHPQRSSGRLGPWCELLLDRWD